MKVLFEVVTLCVFQFANTNALKCVQCAKGGVGGGNVPQGYDCSNKDGLPDANECLPDRDICVYTHTKPMDGTPESWIRSCGKSASYDGAKNKCQYVNFFGRQMTTCVCDKTKDDPLKACNGVMGLKGSLAFMVAILALFRHFIRN